MRIVDLIERNAVLYRDKPAVRVVGGTELTHGELHRRVTALAAGLAGRGVGQGDRIALMAHNGLAYFDVYLAAAYLGAAAVPISARSAPSEVEYVLADAEPTVAIADEANIDAVAASVDDRTPLLQIGSPGYEQMLATDVPAGIERRAGQDDVALVVYTSGTTGRPKGVCLTQGALTFNAVTIALAQRLTCDEVFLTATPLYHVATGTRVTTMALDGQTHVVMPDFDAGDWLAAIDDCAVTSAVLVPTQLRRILDSERISSSSLSSLRLLVYGAAPSALPLVRRAIDGLPCGLYQGYGLTEACTNLTGLLPEEHVDASDERLLTCGRPAVGVSIQIGDEDGGPVPLGEVGEILVRTEKVMRGYWRNETATAQAFADGWLRTGDLARQDADGYITIVDRAKDMLISGGVNVYPSEIEAVLHAHPAVAEAAVVGRRDDEWGEVPVAFVIPNGGAPVDEDDLRAWCRSQLAGLKVPRAIELVDDFPRTASGKVRKTELRS